MPRPTTRVLALLELLQTHARLSGAELAERLQVDRRTVRRYITALEELGIPITAERGRDGGYMLVAGFKLNAPRIAWVMVPAGQTTYDTIEKLSSLLSEGDIVVDGGNSNYKDSRQRAESLAGHPCLAAWLHRAAMWQAATTRWRNCSICGRWSKARNSGCPTR